MFRRFWRRRPAPLRYFLYISDTKLEMLFEQIDPALRRTISAEATIDLKLASLTLRQADPPPAARTAKLRMVERYIDTHHRVGTIGAPGHDYFRGSMPMQWGWLADGGYHDMSISGLDTVFFRGERASYVVVLAGSRRHVLGEQPAAEDSRLFAHSATPNIFAVIGEHISRSPGLSQHWRDQWEVPVDPPEVGLRDAAQLELRGPSQNLEFLALTLIQDDGVPIHIGGWPETTEQVHAVLGTPLYVAVAGNRADRPDDVAARAKLG